MDVRTYYKTTKGGTERDVFSRKSRQAGRRANSTVKRHARRRDRHATRSSLRQLAD